jgi:GNAT superfamily N-acetyltransferase
MKKIFTLKKLSTYEEMLPHWKLVRELSPQLTLSGYKKLLKQMIPHNYYQLAAYNAGKCIAISGYWIASKFFTGKYIEVDNFVVTKHYRSKGLGKIILKRILKEGKRNGCKVCVLDSTVENFEAHKFYYREGFIARGFHYIKYL